ncbi:hypothetical protein ACWGDT_40960 [Streptomyces avermitilis]
MRPTAVLRVVGALPHRGPLKVERIRPARIKWVLSRVDVHDVIKEITDQAATLLRTHRLHGHKYAIDAAFALTAHQPVPVLTSDPEYLTLLCGPAVEVVRVCQTNGVARVVGVTGGLRRVGRRR